MASVGFHQFRALIIKQTKLTLKQKKTICCQIIFPLLMMFFVWMLGFLASVMLSQIPSTPGGGSTDYALPQNFHKDIKDYYQTRGNQTEGDMAPYRILFTANGNSQLESILGNLTSSGVNYGLLGNVEQTKVTLGNSIVTNTYIPVSTQMSSSDAIEHYIYEKRVQDAAKPTGSLSSNADILGGYSFDKVDAEKNKVAYTVHYSSSCEEYKSAISILFLSDRSCQYGVRSMLINFINRAYIKYITGEDVTLETTVHRMPQKMASVDMLESLSQSNYGSIISILLFPLPLFLYTLILEKSSKLREMMKLSGMKMRYYWLSTYVFNMILFSWNIIVIFVGSFIVGIQVISHSNAVVTLLFLFLSAGVVITMSIFLSSFINNPLLGIILGYLFAVLESNVGTLVQTYVIQPTGYSYILLLLFPTIAMHHVIEGGLATGCKNSMCPGFKDLFVPSAVSVGLLFMVIDIIWMLALSIYLDNVAPKEWGIRKSPFYCFEPLVRLVKKLRKPKNAGSAIRLDNETTIPREQEESNLLAEISNETAVNVTGEDEDVTHEAELVESLRGHEYPIIIKHLSKKFGAKQALSKLSLTIQKGECFALLGPNGAGKTTTINILCGLYPPSKGTAYINGIDIVQNIDKARLAVGFCPQHEIFWPELSVEDHLYFFARLKGMSFFQEKAHVNEILEKVGLQGLHGNSQASKLSGGMKKRLSIAIALVGDPVILLLDEPTTGLDPTTRRQIWDIVSQAKHEKSIILTTHSLEEADVLSSRIGIVASGKLQCLGDSFHLKSKFGEGYRLSINFEEDDRETATQSILDIVPDARVISSFAGHCTFSLPKEVQLTWLFTEIETHKETNKIKDYGFSQTTLEDVFMRIVQDEEDSSQKNAN